MWAQRVEKGSKFMQEFKKLMILCRLCEVPAPVSFARGNWPIYHISLGIRQDMCLRVIEFPWHLNHGV